MAFFKRKPSKAVQSKLNNIKLFITDCDGCLTDGGMYYSENGDELHQGIDNKAEVLKQLVEKYNISLEEVAYMGDDVNDLECIKLAGVGICPADAFDEVKRDADFVTNAKGGYGAVREACDLICVE